MHIRTKQTPNLADSIVSKRDSPSQVPVLFIGGEGRSGSTILSLLLGEHRGFVPVGEIHNVWNCVVRNELCSCGRPFHECPFWQEVGTEAFGTWENVDVSAVLERDRQLTRHRHIGRLIGPVERQHRREQDDYRAVISALFRAVLRVSNSQVIVDSSKDATWGFLIRGAKGVDLRLVHLIRDSRGVCFSWSKSSVPQPQYANLPTLRGRPMNRRPPLRAAIEWDVKNLLLHGLGWSGSPRLSVKYERLVTRPAEELQRILGFTMERVSVGRQAMRHEPFAASAESELSVQHTLGGNRVRFERGPLALSVDDEWRVLMPRQSRYLVTAVTAPLLLSYGYVGPGYLQKSRRN